MPRTLKLLLLALSFAAPLCATHAAARPVRQTPAAAQQSSTNDEELERAKRLLAQGDAKGAADALKPIAERRKTDADAWYYLGFALTRAGKPKDARKAFENALKHRPDSPQTRAGLAYALLLLNKPQDAEREASLTLASNPQQAEAHYVVAALRVREDTFPKALEAAEAALRANPDFVAAARLAAEALLNSYYDKLSDQAHLYPAGPGAGKDEIKLAMEKREPALAPFRLKMRELAERLDALAAAQPNATEAATLREQADTLRIAGRQPGQRAPGDIYSSSEVTTRAIITFKPEPGFTQKARENNTTGYVRLRAVLGSDGRDRKST